MKWQYVIVHDRVAMFLNGWETQIVALNNGLLEIIFGNVDTQIALNR